MKRAVITSHNILLPFKKMAMSGKQSALQDADDDSSEFRYPSPIDRNRSLSFADRLGDATANTILDNMNSGKALNLSLRNFRELVGEDLMPYLLKPFLIWATWLIIGAMYYALNEDFSNAQAFYYSGIIKIVHLDIRFI